MVLATCGGVGSSLDARGADRTSVKLLSVQLSSIALGSFEFECSCQ